MDRISQWIAAPSDAYRLWQETEAVGADRRPFSARSRVQHATMFDRFLRYVRTKDMTLAIFGAANVESFFADIDMRCAPGTTTRLRYGKMLDRLCRHLVEEGIRTENPVTAMAAFERWPEDEPVPLFIDADADARLQGWVQPVAGDDDRASRNRAIVALFLGIGVTAAELRQTVCESLVIDGARPHVEVPKRGPRESRRVPLPVFAIAPPDGMETSAYVDVRGVPPVSRAGARGSSQRRAAWRDCARVARGHRVPCARHESEGPAQHLCSTSVARRPK
ncbi:tyrosine-type recombinase/integrase [Paraburkholderia sp. 2C]